MPSGGGKRTCVSFGKVCGKAKLKKLRLTTKFLSVHGRKLGSPSGGTNSDRVQRTKQGAVSGAALRFLQALTRARRKNRLSARGAGETPVRAARLRGEAPTRAGELAQGAKRPVTERAKALRSHFCTVRQKTDGIFVDFVELPSCARARLIVL